MADPCSGRRRKVRCSWSSEEAKVCRRCEERGSECLAQTFFASASDPQRLTSRQRIQQLEAKVSSLGRTIRSIEAKLGEQQLETPDSALTAPRADSNPEDYNDASSSSGFSDVLGEDRPTHLQSLFQNEWISTHTHRQNEKLKEHRTRSSARLLDVARQALQKLMPSKEDLDAVLVHTYATRWIELMHAMFPQPNAITTQADFASTYDELRQPAANAMSLGSWLLSFCLTALQVPQTQETPGPQLSQSFQAVKLAATVTETVEKTILSQDQLINSVEGLGLAMLCGRLLVFQGNFQRGWLQLRRAIAISELMGLPQAWHFVNFNPSYIKMAPDDPRAIKADLWESILSLDRICSTMLNLPSGTKIFTHHKPRPVVVDGRVQVRVYLSRLADVAIKTQDVDEVNTSVANRPEMYNTVLQLDKQLRSLVSEVPSTWWHASDLQGSPNPQYVEPYQILQQWHFYVTLRVHLPFIVLLDSGSLYTYSRLVGLEACRFIIKQYLFIRGSTPALFFLGRFLDLQAFVAMVVLLLSSSGAKSPLNQVELPTADTVEDIDHMVAQVVDLMEERSKHILGSSNFGRHGVDSIRALSKLLRETSTDDGTKKDLSLKIPLLGKLHVSRRRTAQDTLSLARTAGQTQQEPLEARDFSATNPQMNVSTSQHDPSRSIPGANPGPGGMAMQPMGMPVDPLTWQFDNNYEDVVLDAMMEGFDSWAGAIY